MRENEDQNNSEYGQFLRSGRNGDNKAFVLLLLFEIWSLWLNGSIEKDSLKLLTNFNICNYRLNFIQTDATWWKNLFQTYL